MTPAGFSRLRHRLGRYFAHFGLERAGPDGHAAGQAGWEDFTAFAGRRSGGRADAHATGGSITEKLKKYIADPRVTVVVTAMNSREFS